MWNRVGKFILLVSGIIALGYLVHYSYQMYLFATEGPFSTRMCDVSHRLSAPSWYKNQYRTALLVRDYAFDLNFLLYIVDDSEFVPTCKETSVFWRSHDYNPETNQIFHEDLEWSKDATVIAVIIEGEYVFAYDFASGTKHEDQNEIIQLLEVHNEP